uniref:Uncharacterized protein n=1 Tax=Anguilla anguilla TaxID=7936 RepID=A0A0E9V0M3_ANGAN
MPPRTTIPKL